MLKFVKGVISSRLSFINIFSSFAYLLTCWWHSTYTLRFVCRGKSVSFLLLSEWLQCCRLFTVVQKHKYFLDPNPSCSLCRVLNVCPTSLRWKTNKIVLFLSNSAASKRFKLLPVMKQFASGWLDSLVVQVLVLVFFGVCDSQLYVIRKSSQGEVRGSQSGCKQSQEWQPLSVIVLPWCLCWYNCRNGSSLGGFPQVFQIWMSPAF